MKLLATLLAAYYLLVSNAYAGDFHLIELREVTINYKRFNDGARYPLFVESKLKEELSTNVNIDFLRYAYWDNQVQGLTDYGQYRDVNLTSALGIRLSKYLSVEYFHHSEHLLDEQYPYAKFPVQDAFSVHIHVYQRDPGAPTLF